MRHNKKFNHLGRKSAHRKAMLSNMACSLIKHKRITTTTAKAKALQVYVEPILTKSKEDTTHSRRLVFAELQDKEVVAELFRDIAQKIATRPGGYTRILKTGNRLGDNAEMCIIELVDYNENMLKEKAAKKATRTRRAGAKKTTTAKTEEVSVAKTEVSATEEAPVVKTEEMLPVVETEEASVVEVEKAPVAETETPTEEKAAE
jgi:large subunit ribosomal protein L17